MPRYDKNRAPRKMTRNNNRKSASASSPPVAREEASEKGCTDQSSANNETVQVIHWIPISSTGNTQIPSVSSSGQHFEFEINQKGEIVKQLVPATDMVMKVIYVMYTFI